MSKLDFTPEDIATKDANWVARQDAAAIVFARNPRLRAVAYRLRRDNSISYCELIAFADAIAADEATR